MFYIEGDKTFIKIQETKIPLDLIYEKILIIILKIYKVGGHSNQDLIKELFYFDEKEVLLELKDVKPIEKEKKTEISFSINGKSYDIFYPNKIKVIKEKEEKEINFYHPFIFNKWLGENYKSKKLFYYDKNDKIISEKNILSNFWNVVKIEEVKYENNENKINKYSALFDLFFENEKLNEANQLSLNFSYYTNSNINEFKYYQNENRQNFIRKIDHLIMSNANPSNKIYITGISGIGKTVTLLYYLKSKRNLIKTCNFNIKSLFFNQNIKLETEIISLFNKNEKKEYIEFIKNFSNNKSTNIWINIKYILENVKICQNETYIFVFDQYKKSFNKHIILESLINMDKFLNCIFIICSSMNEDDAKMNVIYKNFPDEFSNDLKIIYLNELFSVENLLKKDSQIYKYMKKFNFSPLIYDEYINKYKEVEDINNLKRFLIEKYIHYTDDLKKYFEIKDINIIENYELINESINKDEITKSAFQKIINIIPLKQVGYIQNDKVYKFIPSCDFFYLSLREIYKNTYKTKLVEFYKIIPRNNRWQLGNFFDQLVNWNFDLNKEAFGNKIYHVIILNEIARFIKIKNVLTLINKKEYHLFTESNLNISQIFDG